MANDEERELWMPSLFLAYGQAMYYASLLEKLLHAVDAERRRELIAQGFNLSRGLYGGSGNMADNIKKVVPHDAALAKKLEEAKDSRNHLAHNFWLDNAANVYDRDNVVKLGESLVERTKVFKTLSRRVVLLLVDIGEKKGEVLTEGGRQNLDRMLAQLEG
ncbi:hypothetical protein [Streptomyces sp. NPDC047974]|uniref:hypothetical protein n=1 Tax=Streptomyces sp. NPDC047974 TaxID=3154343 RepID=UPI0033CBA015